MTFKTKLAGAVGLAGMTGVISLLLMQVQVPPEVAASLPLPVLKLLILIQPTILLTIAVLVGVNLAGNVGLTAPAMAAIASHQPVIPALKPQILPGLVGGVVGGLGLVLLSLLWRPWLPAELLAAPATPVLVRFLYGGITEEILLRWGLMTFLVWGAWVLLQRRRGKPKPLSVAIAILVSAILFGVGHLPLIIAWGLPMTVPLIAYIILANSLFGLIAGYLYWQYGLEAAMIAHILCHVVLLLSA